MKKNVLYSWITLVVAVIIILIPVLNILRIIGVQTSIYNQEIYDAIKESCITTGIVVLIAFPLSLLCASCLFFSRMRYKGIFSALCIIPLFLPPISIGFGLLSIFGKNGLVFSLFGIRINLLGRLGIVIGHLLYTFPVSFLLFQNALQHLDISIYESTVLLGIPFYRYYFQIVLPKISKTSIATFFQIIIMSFSEYGVCLIIGGRIKTLSLLVYRYVIGRMDFYAGLILGSFLLIPLIFLSITNAFTAPFKQRIIYQNYYLTHSNSKNIILYILLSFISLFNIVLIFALLFMSLTKNYPLDLSVTVSHFKQVLTGSYIDYYINSLIIALSSSALGCLLSTITAYFAYKSSSWLVGKLLYFVATVSYIIPGLLFGIGYLITYRGSVIYGTYIILILANIAHFFASPFLLCYGSVSNFSPEYDDILQLYGISTISKTIDVIIPYLKNTLLDMFFFIFTNSMITISAVAFLFSSHTMPYALLLNSFEGGIEYLGKSAAISLIIMTTNLVFFILINSLKNKHSERS